MLNLLESGESILSWENLSYKIGKKKILYKVEGSIISGQLCCLMGPSGSGKTSLLNILSGRITPNKNVSISGEIVFNGEKIKPKDFTKKIAYVMQEDAINQFTTVKEALTFSLKLRTNYYTQDKVDEMIYLLHLSKCSDTLVKNLSGGEKKRLAIGIELITNPSIIFLDEPTSGLDSYAALNVINNIKKLIIKTNCMVLLSIHQPSSEIFHLFDKLFLLKDGRAIHEGTIEQTIDFYQSLHFLCPIQYNPADFILLKLQTEELSIFQFGNRSSVSLRKTMCRMSVFDKNRIFKNPNSFLRQLYLLSQREYYNTIRDTGTLIARIGISSLLNLLFALIFKGSGNQPDIMTHFGALVQIAISAMFSSTQPTLIAFPVERPIFIREYYTGTYDIIPYFLSKLVIELPITFFLSFLTMIIRYWIMELQGNIGFFMLEIWILGLVASSIALFLGSITKNIKIALEASPLIFVPQIMFAGFFIKMSQIPHFLRWAQYLCSLKFTINLMMITEFGECDTEECQKLLSDNDVDKSLWWVYLCILIGLFVLFRVLSLISLSKISSNF